MTERKEPKPNVVNPSGRKVNVEEDSDAYRQAESKEDNGWEMVKAEKKAAAKK